MSDVINDVKNVPDTFSSWDKCMQKAYCKWPAIIGIVIGSLILLSFIWCVARCLCCGAQLCSCCCGGCGSCCGSRRDRPSKYKDDYTRMPPAPYGGYQPAPAPMAYGPPAHTPQFATFDDSSRKVNEDSLPPMPSWDTATKRRVEDASDLPQHNPNGDLEMGRLDSQSQRMRGGYNSVPNGPMSPVSPHPQRDYLPNDTGMIHSYNSDLGAQRMGHNGDEYNSFQAVPLSPPPTYRSNSNAPSVVSDKFMPGAASPSPGEFQRQAHQYQQPSSYAPSTASTRYEPQQQDYTVYNGPQQYQTRPPSFLQPGRKPVNGSFREV